MLNLNSYYFFYLILIVLLNIILYLNIEKLSKILNLYDYPDNDRKLHKNKTPLLGGVFIFISTQILVLFLFFNSEVSSENFYFYSFKSITTFFLVTYLIFFIGYLDDKYSISPDKKLVLLLFFSYVFVLSDNTMTIENIRSDFFNLDININKFSPIFTSLVIITFMMASNMFDGIDGQSSSFFIFLLIVLALFNSHLTNSLLILIIILIIFLYYNLRSKIFLGDNGVYFLSFIIATFYIKTYNIFSSISFDELILVSLIPMVDLMRVSLIRISKGNNPMRSDRLHLHYLIPDNNYRILKIFLLTILPLSIDIIFNNILISILLPIVIYFYLILKK